MNIILELDICILKELHQSNRNRCNILKLAVNQVLLQGMMYVQSFFSDNTKQDNATTSSQSKHLIELLKQREIMFTYIITTW